MSILKKRVKQKLSTLVIFFFIFNIGNVYSQIYNEIKIEGNDRLSVETIIMFSGLETGLDITSDDLNNSIKELYKTDYFKDVQINTFDKIIKISISENPIYNL